MAQAGQVFVNFGANTQGLLTGTARAGNILQRFSQTGVGAAVVLGASFVTLSRTMTNFVTSSISGFKEFDYQIVRAKALAGATTEEYNKMRDVATELGRTTEWMAKDVAAGMSNLALAGFKANEIIEMIPESLRLATAGGVNLSKTNTIMANAMRSFNLEADQANQVSNVLTATFTTTNTTLESLAQTIKNAAGVLGTIGVKIEEVSAAAGVLGDVGILASVAGTGLKNYGIKLAKTFGIMKDATQSAKEYFEALGVTKDRLFDAETGTFNIVEATIAFKEAMDKLGKAKAPEFLAQFSTLFGERAAVSLTALVRKAEQFKIQAQNIRMTEMIGDVQQVFEQTRSLGNETAYMTNIQEGLNDAVKNMVKGLSDADIYMEEFTDSGEGAAGAITRLSRSFKNTQKVIEDTFGKDIFSLTKNGLISVNEYGKESAISMVRLNDVLNELSKKDIGKKRREELEEERKRLEELIVTGKKDVSQLTDQGRARLINLASLYKYISAIKESQDGTSKSANQLETLNNVFKGNAQNVAMAARAFGIQLSANDKLSPSLKDISKEMDKIANSTESQIYSMQRLTSQVAMTNTAMDMQIIQLETLDGIMKIFQSGIELVSNKIAKALSPALGAIVQSVTSFMRVLTLSNDEIDRGITASDKLKDSWRETLKIFTDGESIFSRITKGFEGLSSIGKTLALVMGSLGAAGLAAGGAFIWVQALLPAFSALASTFLSVVMPVGTLAAAVIALSVSFKKAYEQSKMVGDISSKSIEEIMKAYNSAENVIKGFSDGITILDAEIIKVWSNFNESINKIKNQFSSLMTPLEQIAQLTNIISVTGGQLTLFNKDNNGVITIKDTLKTINDLMENLGNVSEDQKEKIRAAIKAGDASMINMLLSETPGLIDSITEAGMRMTIFRKDQDVKSSKFQSDLKEINIILNGLQVDAIKSGETFKKALNSNNIEDLNNILKNTPELLNKLKEAGINADLLNPEINKNIGLMNSTLSKLKQRMSDIVVTSEEDKIALAKAFKTNDIEKINSILQKTPDLLNKLKESGIDIDLLNIGTVKEVNNTLEKLKEQLGGIKLLSNDDKVALMEAFKTNNINEVNNILSKNKELLGAIAKEGLMIGFATETQQKRFKDLNSLIQGRKEIQDQVNKKLEEEIAKNDQSIDSQTEINRLKKESSTLEKEINNFLTERNKLQEDIITGKGKIAKLTKNEMEMLDKLQLAINQRSISVGKLKIEQERLLKLQKNGVDVTKDLIKVNADLSREHSLLVDNQKKYNKILNDASSLNPFTVAIRAMREISNSKTVKTAILELSKLVTDFAKYVADELIPRIMNVSSKFFTILKSSSTGTMMSIFRLIRSFGSLFGDIIKYGLDAIGILFDYINNDGNKIFSKVSTGINGVSNLIDSIRSKVEPFMKYISIILIALYNTIKDIMFKIGPPIIALLKSLGNLFAAVFTGMGKIFTDIFNKIEGKGVDIFTLIGIAINKVAETINKMANAIKNSNVSELEKLGIIGLSVFATFKLLSGAFGIFSILVANLKHVKNQFGPIISYLDKIFKPLFKGKGIIETIFNISNKLFTFLTSNLLLVTGILTVVIALAGSLYEAWKKNYGGIRDIVKNVASNIVKNIGKALYLTFNLLGKVGSMIVKIVSKIFDIGKAFAPIIGPIASVLTALIGGIINGILLLYNFIVLTVNKTIDIINTLLDSKLINGIINALSSLVKMITDIFIGLWKLIFGDAEKKSENWFSEMVSWIEWIYPIIEETIKDVWKVFDNYMGKVFDVISGMAEIISAIANGTDSQFIAAIIKVYKAASDIIIKIEEKVFGVIDRWVGFFKLGIADAFDWIRNRMADIVEKIPVIGGKDKADTMRKEAAQDKRKAYNEAIDLIDGKANEERIKLKRKEQEIVIKDLQEMQDQLKSAEENNAKAKAEVEKNKKSQIGIKKSAEDKNKKDQEVQKQGQYNTQVIKGLDTSVKNLNDNVGKIAESRQNNVTNNTYVEYRAAEDDEVNRRMIERVMNDILKADIGLMMGDTAGFNAAE